MELRGCNQRKQSAGNPRLSTGASSGTSGKVGEESWRYPGMQQCCRSPHSRFHFHNYSVYGWTGEVQPLRRTSAEQLDQTEPWTEPWRSWIGLSPGEAGSD